MRSLLLPLLLASTGVCLAQETDKPPAPDSTTKTKAAEPVEEEAPLTVTSTVPKRIDVRWKAVPGAAKYELWRKLEPNGEWKRLEELLARETSLTDTSVVPRVRASYKLIAFAPNPSPSKPVGPVEALDDFYVHLKSAKKGRATLYVYMHRAGQWLKSAEQFEVKVGQVIGEADVLADFTTGAKLIAAGALPTDPKVGRAKYLTKDRRLITVLTTEEPPVSVTGKKKKKKRVKKAVVKSKPKTVAKGPTVTTGKVRVLKFPEPRKVGTVPGKRIVWDIINKSELRMQFVIMSRKSTRNFFVGTDQTYRVRLPQGGTYTVTVNASNNKVLPMKGKFGLLEGTKYETKFNIQKVDRQKRLRELKGK